MRSYEAARGLFSFLGFCSWIVIIGGGLIAFAAMSAVLEFGRNAGPMQAALAALPGLTIGVLGLYGLALVQMGRAGVDGAEYAQQSLDVSRKQLEVSQQLLSQGKQMAMSYAALKPKPLAAPPDNAQEAVEGGASYGDQMASAAVPAAAALVAERTLPEAPSAGSHALPGPVVETTLDELMPQNEAVPAQPSLPRLHEFSGSQIEEADGVFTANGRQYATLLDAKLSIDANLARSET